jgi:hypothetical protein
MIQKQETAKDKKETDNELTDILGYKDVKG